MAARLQQGPPVLGAGNHLPVQAAVAQEVGQPHLRVAHILAHLQPAGDGHAASGLSQVEATREARQGQENHGDGEDEDFSGNRHCGALVLHDLKSRGSE